MAIGTPYSIAATVALTTSSTDASITTNALAHSGDTIYVWCAQRLTNAAVYNSLTGATGGTVEFVTRKHSTNAEGVSICRQHLTSDLASGSVLTGTLDLTTSRKVVGAFAVPGVADLTVDTTDTGADGTTGTPTGGTTGTPSLADAISIAIFQHNTTANTETGTQDGTHSYTEIGDLAVGASSWSGGYAEYKVLSSAAAQSGIFYTPSVTTTTAWVALTAVWIGISGGGGGGATLRDLGTLGVGV